MLVAANSHNEMENLVTVLKCATYFRLGVGYMLLLTCINGFSLDAACRVYFVILQLTVIIL